MYLDKDTHNPRSQSHLNRRQFLGMHFGLIVVIVLYMVVFLEFCASPPSPSPTPTSMVSSTPTSMVLPTPTSMVLPTPTSMVSSTPTSMVSPPPTSMVSPPQGPPLSLQHRSENSLVTAVGGHYENPFHGSLGGKYLMFYRGDTVILKGQGYFLVRWEVAYFNRVGQLVMPTWTNQNSTLLHVASGGGHRIDDRTPPPSEAGQTWMGRPSKGWDTLPAGTPMIWQNEFYYLDGTVTLHENEGYADYNLGITPKLWSDVTADINHAPQAGTSWIRYGITYDH